MDLVKIIRRAIDEVITGFWLGKVEYVVEHPMEIDHGDYAINAAMIGFKKVRDKFKSPLELAEAIVENLKDDENLNKIASEIKIAKPGFINISIKNDILVTQLERLLKDGVGKSDCLWGKKVMVEYAHPNTHKQFHIGHLRNICLGESISRILEAMGVEVIRTNYQGDIGLHIAKAVWGVKNDQEGYQKAKKGDEFDRAKFLGQAYAKGSKAYEEKEDAKKQIIEYNQQIFSGKGEIVKLWQETRLWSLGYFDEIYKRVGVKYDRLYFESECVDGVKKAREALEKGVLKESQGAVVFDGSAYGLDTRVFINSIGLPTYEAKELSLAPKEYTDFGNIDKCIHVVGPEQKSFFAVTFKVEELLDSKMFKGKQYHKVYGYVDLKKGKMSSRKGKVVTASWLLDEAKERIMKTYQSQEVVAEKIAVGAVKYAFLKVQPLSKIGFDIKESIRLEGNSGPYLQYTYARCQSVLEKSKDKKAKKDNQEFTGINYNAEELGLLRTIYRFEEMVAEAAEELAPNKIADWMFSLAQKYNLFYHQHSILKAETDQIRDFRLFLTKAVALVIKNGLYLLGIETPRRM